jgi:signal transduction histidine kinase
MIEEGARRCMEIVQALLKYSKPPQASYLTVDLRAVVEDTLAMVERQGQMHAIQLVTDLVDPPAVLGDAAELRQVVVQLLLNAADAIHETGRPGTVRVSLRRELEGLVLAIADDGVGIPPEIQNRIFDPFFTTKDVGAGKGLALSVCRRVLEKHGGRIQAVSTLGVGTTFTIMLPVP